MERKPGRPPGTPKTGGRQKGVPNRATRLREQAVVRALVAEQLTETELAELTPLAVMLRIMRSAYQAGDTALALHAAQAAGPFVHARLTAADVRITGSLDSKSDADIAAELAELQAKLDAATRVH